jgi:hypothetical protein
MLGLQSDRADALGLIVFKLDVQAVLDADLHLDGIVRVWWHAKGVDPEFLLLDGIAQPPRHGDPNKIAVSRP